MKVNRKEYVIKSNRTFTDRVEPRKIFWDKYEQVKSEINEDSNINVLTYYGIGGIGKSRLLSQLQLEMDERIEKPLYIDIDFKDYQDSRITLNNLKNKLTEKYKFEFPLFDLGYYVYARKVGEKEDSQETTLITDKSPFLKILKTTLGYIPFVNVASPILDIADELVPHIINHIKNNKKSLIQIDVKSTDELHDYLAYLFAEDMVNNLNQIKEPFVFFIDTYEKLVNELSQIGEPLQNDLWIRGEYGLIQRIPKCLWVVGGREKLKWERFDTGWSDSLNQHLLGSLSPEDSEDFLKSENVEDAKLRNDLCKLTKGTPVYLNLCVDQYNNLIDSGEIPDIAMFGHDLDSLVARFVKYMGDAQKDLVYILSCLGTWTDELVSDIAPKVLSNFSITAYDKIKDYSFVNYTDGKYSIHQTIGEVLEYSCPDLIKKPTAKLLIESSEKAIEENNMFSPDYAEALFYMLQGALLLYDDSEKLREFYTDKLLIKTHKLVDANILEIPKNMIDKLFSKCSKKTDELLYACVLVDKAYIHSFEGEYIYAKEAAEEAYRIYIEKLGYNHFDTLIAMNDLASVYEETGNFKKALELGQMCYDKRLEILGEIHPLTLISLNNLSGYYASTGNFKKALELSQLCYDKRAEILGDSHLDTIATLHNLAACLADIGNSKKALELAQDAYNKRRELLGENHPDTLNTLNSLATYYSELNSSNKALELSRIVYEKRLELFGENHPLSLQAMSNMASYLSETNNIDEALALGQVVLDKTTEILGENHPRTLLAAVNLASHFSDAGNNEKALELAKPVLDKRLKILGENHPDTLHSMHNLSTYYCKAGNIEKALEISHTVYDKRLEVLGENHPDLLNTTENIANFYFENNEPKKSLEWLEQLYKKKSEIFGERHPKTIETLRDLIYLCQFTGNKMKEMTYKNKLKSKKKR